MKNTAPLWPAGVSQPAYRALAAAGFIKIEELTAISKKDLGKLHGMGPKALGLLEKALTEKGLAFKAD